MAEARMAPVAIEPTAARAFDGSPIQQSRQPVTSKSGVIVTRTPLRVSFLGGGTDLKDFWQHEDGAVLSTTIDKYVYVTVKRHSPLFGERYRLNYSATEHVHKLDDMKNDIARECIRLLDIEAPIYISTVADIPASSGLGSSSSFAVGLLHALHAYRGERVSAGQLAQEACHVEIDLLGHPIGKQDQYAAAFGGVNHFTFRSDGGVSLEPQNVHRNDIDALFDHMLLFFTGVVRSSASVLTEQKRNTPSRMDTLRTMKMQADHLRACMHEGLEPARLGALLNETWLLKRQLASTISNPTFDAWYDAARAAGAWGGKILGAGGGGFFLIVAPPDRHDAIRAALPGLVEVPVGYESHGSHLLMPTIE